MYNEPTYYNVRLNLPVAVGNSSVAVVRVVQRKALDGMDMKLVKEEETIIKSAFTDTEAFWKA